MSNAKVSREISEKVPIVGTDRLFEKLFEFSPDAVLVTDKNGSIVRANRQTEGMFGFDRQDLIGQPVEILIPERFRSIHPKHRGDYAEQSRTRPMGAGLDLYARRRNKTEFPVDIMLSPLTLEGQSFTLAVVRDITERKQAEQERDRQASIVRGQAALLELAHDSIIVRDLENRITFWNRGAEEQYGWRREEALGQHTHTFLKTQFSRPLEEVERALHRNRYWEGEVTHATKDGRRIIVASRRVLQCDASGNPTAILEINNDITQRKQAEEAVRKSEDRLRCLFEFSPDAIVVSSREGKITEVNAQLERYFGYSRSELQGQPIELLIPDQFRTMHPSHRADYVAQPRVRAMGAGLDLCGRRKNGSTFPVDIMLGPMDGAEGPVVLAVIRDLSQKKKDEEALRRVEQTNIALRDEINEASMSEQIICASPALRGVLESVAMVATTDSTVLITGETGTGKELIARSIHRQSHRSSRVFVRVNCAAIPRDLIASELFGHEKGSFTGATEQRLGRFELAERGTIFLDEIGELPAETQTALLRVLQEHEFERVGGTRPIQTNVRVIAATNRDLQAAIDTGIFRSDLYYRLNVFPIELPPLRQCVESIPMLVEHFVDRYARKMGKKIRGVDRQTLDLLQSYSWPGNVRELQNLIERAVIVSETENLSVDEAWLGSKASRRRERRRSLSESLVKLEKETIEAALTECKGRVYGPLGAATKLGIPPSTLGSKIKSLKIDKRRF